MSPGSWLLACWLAFLSAPLAAGQEKALQRIFPLDAISRYRILLTVRSEVEGQESTHIGAKTYIKPFSRVAEGQLSWRATRRIFSVNTAGSAEIEETLDEFSTPDKPVSPQRGDGDEFEKAVSTTLTGWSHATPLTLRYRETRAGKLEGLTADGMPALEEASPYVLSLWLLRALRPAAALPARPVRLGDHWEEPRVVLLANWAETRGAESGQWMRAHRSAEPAVRLQIEQQILGTVADGPEKPPEGTARAHFYSESLNTISLADGRLLAATRSAAREVSWTLAPVEGLPEPPRFRGRLSVEIQIESCDEDPCRPPDRAGVR